MGRGGRWGWGWWGGGGYSGCAAAVSLQSPLGAFSIVCSFFPIPFAPPSSPPRTLASSYLSPNPKPYPKSNLNSNPIILTSTLTL